MVSVHDIDLKNAVRYRSEKAKNFQNAIAYYFYFWKLHGDH